MEILNYIINNNFYISFAGRITYKTAKKSIQVAQIIPNALFLVETDSPYISPEPYRDSINHPDNIKYIINKLAEIKEINYSELENLVDSNAKRLFKKIR